MPGTVPPFETVSAKELLARPIEPLDFTIDAILPCGLFLLAGRGKIGKSWLALDMAHCIAGGGRFWHFRTAQGDVLYLALEDNHRRLQDRLAKISPAYDADAATDIHFVTRAKRLGEGLAEQLAAFLGAHPATRLIVIDTLWYVRGGAGGTYAGDYRDMDALREAVAGRGLTVLLVTHTRKAGDADPLNLVSGSSGLAGAADGIFILEKDKRAGSTARLTIANRDTGGRQFALRFDRESCRWQFLEEIFDGDDDGDEERQLYDALCILLSEDHTEWRGTATQLHAALVLCDPAFGMSAIAMARLLRRRCEFLRTQYGITCTFTRGRDARVIELSRSIIVADCGAPEPGPLLLVG